MPHLSLVQEQFAKDGVTVVGVTSADRSNTLEAVKKMVEAKSDVMRYTVAWDEGRSTYTAYMEAAKQRGIPTSFLVDGVGKVAWIGHPSQLDTPLSMVVEGTWDYVKGPAMMKRVSEELIAIRKSLGTPKEALARFDALAKEFPKVGAEQTSLRFSILARLPEMSAEAEKLGAEIVADAIGHKSASKLNQFAWELVDPQVELANRFLPLALRAATSANELTEEKDPAILDTLARVHFWMGDIETALRVQFKAVEFSKGEMKKELQGVADEYKAKLESKRAS